MTAQTTARTLATIEDQPAEGSPEPCIMVIFGASGDLTRRMLLPALYDLALDRRLPPRFAVVGFARTDWSDDDFRDHAKRSVEEFGRRPLDDRVWESFAGRLFYVAGEYGSMDAHDRLFATLRQVEAEHGASNNHMYYLAVPPGAFPDIIEQLREHKEEDHADGEGWSRVIVEKPFGQDLESARELNQQLHSVFEEDNIFRIDHYLGKETVQNILVFRFANGIFEPVWNRRYVDHVQITVAESIGVGGRGGFYDQTGALRDMVQNHLMQLLSLVAMEPPIAFNGTSVRNEKVKVLRGVRHLEGVNQVREGTARGQYGRGWVAGEEVRGYREEKNVDPESTTETYAALRLFVDSWRWADVPFYLRTGKRMPKRSTEVAIEFKSAPHLLFRQFVDVAEMEPNVLSMRIQPNEGISIKFLTKVPGSPVRVRPANMDFLYGASFLAEAPSAYETLLLDAMRGDATLFARGDEVEAAWAIMMPVLEAWQEMPPPDFPNYEAGAWGPKEAEDLIEKEGRRWRTL